MISGIHILLYIVGVIVFAPLVWATVRLNSARINNFFLLFARRNAYLGVSATKRLSLAPSNVHDDGDSNFDKLALQICIQQLNQKIVTCQNLLNASISAEQELKEKVNAISTGDSNVCKSQIANENSISVDVTSEFAETRIRYIAFLNGLLTQKADKLVSLNERLSELQKFADAALTIEHAKVAQNFADILIHECEMEQATRVITRMEMKVWERELKSKATRPLVPPAVSDEDHQTIEKLAAKIPSLQSIGAKFWDSVAVIDPSTDRSFSRLLARLDHAQNLADESKREEDALVQLLTHYREEIGATELQLQDAHDDSNTRRENRLVQKKEHWLLCVADLDKALKLHSERNLSNDQLLFQLRGIVKRLSILQTLLKALPHSSKEDIRQFKNTVNAVCRLIALSISSEKQEVNAPGTDDLLERLSSLERNILTRYINIAKRKIVFSESTSRNFVQRLEQASAVLQAEQKDLQLEYERWEKQATQPSTEQQSSPSRYAAVRKQQCAAILKIMERSADALKVAAKGASPKSGKAPGVAT